MNTDETELRSPSTEQSSGKISLPAFLLFHSVLLCLLYGPVLKGQDLYYRDIVFNYWPQIDFIRSSLLSGDLPFWNPTLQNGAPFMAALEPPVFYPPAWLFLLPWRFSLLLVLNLGVHHLIGASGFFVIARALGWRPLSVYLASLSWSLSGIIVSLHNVHPLMNTVAWLPLLFALTLCLCQRPSRRWGLSFAVAYSLQILSGHLEIVLLSSGLILSYVLLHFRRKAFKATVFYMAIASLSAIFLSALQLWPSLLYRPLSSRATGLSFEAASVWSFHPFRSLEFFLPHTSKSFLQPWSLQYIWNDAQFGYSPLLWSVYVGIVPLFFILMACYFHREHKERTLFYFMCCLAIAAWILACGKYFPVYALLHQWLPGLAYFRYPEKYLTLFIFAHSMLVAFGMETFLRHQGQRHWRPWLVGWLSLGGLCVGGRLLLHKGQLLRWIEQYRYDMTALQQELMARGGSELLEHQWLYVLGIVLLLALLGALSFRGKVRLAQGGLMVLLSFELLNNAWQVIWSLDTALFSQTPRLAAGLQNQVNFNPQLTRLDVDLHNLKQMPESYQAELKAQRNFRLAHYRYNALMNDLGSLFGYRQVFSHWPAHSAQMGHLENLYRSAVFAQRWDYRYSFEVLTALRYLALFNPSAATVQALSQNDSYRRVLRDSELKLELWENQDALPRVRFQYQAFQVPKRQDALDIMAYPEVPGFDPQKHLILLKNDALDRALKQVPSQAAQKKRWTDAKIVEESNQYLKIEFETNTSGYLILADQDLPGWKALDNGKETPILNANYFMRAVRVGPGHHSIEFRYTPPGLWWGALFSLLGCLGLFALGKGLFPAWGFLEPGARASLEA